MKLRVQFVIAFLCVALFIYFAMLARTAVVLIRTGTVESIALGVGVLALPVVGVWVVLATLRAGFAHQRLARMAAEDGMDLAVENLPTMPSGRIERDAADALFATVRTELEADPDNWRRWYRLARAYDYAGDRRRARETMRKAVALEAGSR
ncbi:MAG: hypothetical protein ACR2JI_15610 [Mycobacterium sp.]